MITPVTLDAIVSWFEALSPGNVADTPRYYAPEALFRDPFNEVRGTASIERIYRHMFEQVEDPRFTVTHRWQSEAGAILLSELRCRAKRGGTEFRIRCATHLEFDAQGRITLHRDYWDPAEDLYEKVPVLGSLMRFIRSRLRVPQD